MDLSIYLSIFLSAAQKFGISKIFCFLKFLLLIKAVIYLIKNTENKNFVKYYRNLK